MNTNARIGEETVFVQQSFNHGSQAADTLPNNCSRSGPAVYNPVGKHFRSIKRAIRRVRLRRINPALAARLIGRSCYRIVRAVVVLVLLLMVAAMVILIIASGTTIRKLRGIFGFWRLRT